MIKRLTTAAFLLLSALPLAAQQWSFGAASGPFVFGEYVAGSHWTGKKNPNYYIPGRPYLDGFRAIFIRDTAPRVAAVRSGQVMVEFRGFNPAARDDVVKSLGSKAVVQESPWACNLMVVFNNEKKPFSDARVRRALNLAIDRNEASKALAQISVILTYKTLRIEPTGKELMFFAGIDDARFGIAVRPGDRLDLRSEVVRIRKSLGWFRGRAEVGGRLVAEMSMLAAIQLG